MKKNTTATAVTLNHKKKVGAPLEDKILYTVVDVVMALWLIIVLFPVIFILASSFSSSTAINTGRVLLWPVEFTTAAYEAVFRYKAVWVGFANTIFYTVVGTAINLVATTLCAYPLSRRTYQGRSFVATLFIIPMFISGGLIPSYLNVRDLGLLDNRLALFIPGLISTSNMILMRTFFTSSIPTDLQEAASLDGCSDIRYLLKVVLPLSKAVLSVLLLYYAVGHWNSYYSALLYLRTSSKYPVQLILRTVLISYEGQDVNTGDAQSMKQQAGEAMRYGLIVVTTVPVLMVYPFIQKHFEKGVMIGSLKG